MHKLGERCDLFQEGGSATDPAIDKRMDFHFNAILDVVSEWRKDKSQNQDTPLGGTTHLWSLLGLRTLVTFPKIPRFYRNSGKAWCIYYITFKILTSLNLSH